MLKFIVSLVSATLLLLFLNGNIRIPNMPLPPLGNFLNPYNGIWTNARKVGDQQILLSNKNILGDIDIYYDSLHVPHIKAQHLEDALFAQGYVHGQNRLFQMDFITRAASGRLSEVVGPKALEMDRKRLRSHVPTAAKNALKGWQKFPQEYALAQHYVDGINAYINQLQPKDYPIEYKLLDMKPEPWTMEKSALVFKSMAEILAGHSSDIQATNMRQLLGKSVFDQIYPEYEDGGYPVIDYGNKAPTIALSEDSLANMAFPKSTIPTRQRGIGSNNWAVSGKKTKTGRPIFCNDPHLTLSLPSIWFQQQIVTPTFNAYGVAIPGAPGILMGFNEHIAWGETNVSHDLEDYFLIKWIDKAKTTYLVDGKEHKVNAEIVQIKVKGQAPFVDTIRSTIWGPLKFDLEKNATADIATTWLPAEVATTPELLTFVNGMQAKSYDDYLDKTAIFNYPAQNFLCASTSGDVGLRVNGKFPIRAKEDGRFVKLGDNSSNGWSDFIPRDKNPQEKNANRNYSFSSNQRSTSTGYPYYYTGLFEHFRNRSIGKLLDQCDTFSVEMMMKMQANSVSVKAQDILPTMLAQLSSDDEISTALKAWNHSYDKDSKAATYFELWFEHLRPLVFDEVYSLSDTYNVLEPEDYVLVQLVTKNPKSSLFDLKSSADTKETMKDMVLLAYQKMKGDVTKIPAEKQKWGNYRSLDIMHITKIPAFSVPGLAVSGHADAINANKKTFGPSWRMIVSLEDSIKAYGIYPGGQSGDPASKHYQDMVAKWADQQYLALPYVKNFDDLGKNAKIHIKFTKN